MREFKVGDIVCGKKGSSLRYGYTNEDMSEAKVVDILPKHIEIEVINHKLPSCIGDYFTVESRYFELAEPPEIKEEITISLEKDKKSVLCVYKRDNEAVREELFKLGDGISFMDAAKDILDNFDNDQIKYSLNSLEGTRNAITWDSAEEFIELMDRIFGGNDGKDMSLYIEDGTITIDDTDFLEGFGYNLIPYTKVTMD